MTTTAIRSNRPRASVAAFVGLVAATVALAPGSRASADGLMKGLKSYKGSINESSQEAVIIFHDAKRPGDAVEDLILKVFVQGKGKEDVKNFAWIVPFPNEPTVEKEDPKRFEELHNYVERRLAASRPKPKFKGGFGKGGAGGALGGVEVLAKKVVGAFDVAIVREKEKGALNKWLDTEGYQTIDDADDVLAFYREQNYVFACIKVTEAQSLYMPMERSGLYNLERSMHQSEENYHSSMHPYLERDVKEFQKEVLTTRDSAFLAARQHRRFWNSLIASRTGFYAMPHGWPAPR